MRAGSRFEPYGHSIVDKRGNAAPTLSMLQGTLYKDMGRTGGVVKLEIDVGDKVPETQELENKEDVVKRDYFRAPIDPEAPSYVENIITSKFYPVKKPPTLVNVEKEPEYESAEEIFESDIKDYLRLLKQLSVNAMIFMGGIIAGIGMLHFYVLFFSGDESKFLTMYSRISKGVESIYHMFGFLCTILTLFLMLLNFSGYKKATSKLSPKAGAYMLHFIFYAINFVCTVPRHS
eukprot:TRINITY_DN9314_c0_g6_i1.p1 TRINITY_DN9314_c0_g6~~TRINITY_DN9314_c0_g6_i1.p1  ORF type:complete len:233 (-),score=53.48 TRINITY_DN9314_c0_g6_i1:487-1185(-)